MSTATASKVSVQICDNGNLIRTWSDDGEINVQLTTPNSVEIARARFTGKSALDMADLVADTWWHAAWKYPNA